MESKPPSSKPFKIDFGDEVTESKSDAKPPASAFEAMRNTGAHQLAQLTPFALIVRETPVTMVVMALNLAIFFAMVIYTGGEAFLAPSNKVLYDWGADYGPATLAGDFWRVTTSTFLHAGIVHIASNMYVLFSIGRVIERMFGSSKFAAIYLLAGLGGSLVSLYFHPQTISVGASGAVFGCFGAFLMILRAHQATFDKDAMRATVKSVVVVLVINLLFGISHKNIDNSAHIGGFLTGVLAGACALPNKLGERHWSTQNIGWTVFLLLMLVALGYTEYFSFQNLTH